jgi:Transposase DDE domain
MAVDGKTLRRSYDSTAKALHLVSAFATEARLVLAQTATAEKSNEISAIPELLRLLDLRGATVSIDAMGCQREMAAQIVEGGGHYLLGLKGNQGRLHEDVRLFFENPPTGTKWVDKNLVTPREARTPERGCPLCAGLLVGAVGVPTRQPPRPVARYEPLADSRQ